MDRRDQDCAYKARPRLATRKEIKASCKTEKIFPEAPSLKFRAAETTSAWPFNKVRTGSMTIMPGSGTLTVATKASGYFTKFLIPFLYSACFRRQSSKLVILPHADGEYAPRLAALALNINPKSSIQIVKLDSERLPELNIENFLDNCTTSFLVLPSVNDQNCEQIAETVCSNFIQALHAKKDVQLKRDIDLLFFSSQGCLRALLNKYKLIDEFNGINLRRFLFVAGVDSLAAFRQESAESLLWDSSPFDQTLFFSGMSQEDAELIAKNTAADPNKLTYHGSQLILYRDSPAFFADLIPFYKQKKIEKSYSAILNELAKLDKLTGLSQTHEFITADLLAA